MRSTEDGNALGVVLVVLALALALSAIALRAVQTGSNNEAALTTDVKLDAIGGAAIHHAFAEIYDGADLTGNGLGAMGLVDPVPLLDGAGRTIGEYRTIILQEGDTGADGNVIPVTRILALAAVPSFAAESAGNGTLKGFESTIGGNTKFFLRPNAAAISISGPVKRHPDLRVDHIGEFLIDGGDKAAVVVSDTDSYEQVYERWGDLLQNGSITEDNLLGAPLSTYDDNGLGEIQLPIQLTENTALTAEDLNNYRNTLRTQILTVLEPLATDRVTSPISADVTFGSPNSPAIVVVDGDVIGSTRAFRGENQVITGYGTLIIKHTTYLRYNQTLNWEGDIYVLGFDGDGSNLFYLYGIDGTINGNLVLLSSDNTEASLEIANSESSRVGSGDERPGNLTVNGNVMVLAETASREAEVDIEMDSTLTVNGMITAFGSRIEIESNSGSDYGGTGTGSGITVTGAMQLAIPADNTRTDDLTIDSEGFMRITYDEVNFQAALDALDDLENNLRLNDLGNQITIKIGGGRSAPGGALTEAELEAHLAAKGGPTANVGLVLDGL